MSSITRRCKECGTRYYGDEVEAMFQVGKGVKCISHPTYHAVCNLCLLTARTEAKQANRFVAKAKGTIKRHAKKLGYSVSEMADRFLWTVDGVAADMERAWSRGCVDCDYQFHEMHDLTLDVTNPGDPPYYGTNTRFICATCNRRKSRTPARLWGALKAATARWVKQQAENAKLPKWVQGRLFDD